MPKKHYLTAILAALVAVTGVSSLTMAADATTQADDDDDKKKNKGSGSGG